MPNTLLFLTARKTLKPLRHDLLHYLLKVERERERERERQASVIRMDMIGRRLAAKHGGPRFFWFRHDVRRDSDRAGRPAWAFQGLGATL